MFSNNNMDYILRDMCIEDYDAVLALWSSTPGVCVLPVDSRAGISRYLARNQGMSTVAIHNGSVVGAVLCGDDGRSGTLHHLAVSADYRRHGVGTACVRRCMDKLAAVGITWCSIFVYNDNADGIEYWKSRGWSAGNNFIVMSRAVSNENACGAGVGHMCYR